jgi:DNA-binding transcriptional LysR family regulator
LRDVLARLADAEGRVQSEGSEPEGLLRVTMPTAYGRTSVLPRLAALARRYPRLRFDFDLSDRYVDILEEGYDLAIRIGRTDAVGPGVRAHRPLHAACAAPSPDYVAKHAPVERPQDLAAHACIVQRDLRAAKQVAISNGRATWSRSRIAPRIVVSDMMAVQSLVLEGTGVAILPSFLARDDLASGKLVELLGEAGLPAINVFATLSASSRQPLQDQSSDRGIAARLIR